MKWILTCSEYDGGHKTFVKSTREECVQEVIEWIAIDDDDAAEIRKAFEDSNKYDCGDRWEIESIQA